MTSPKGRGGTRRLAGALAGGLLLASILAGCSSARSSLGTSDSSCYLALPAATKAIGGHGRLLGVDLFTLGSLRHKAPHLYKALAPRHDDSERVCVVAFGGVFDQAMVAHPRGRSSGRLAVVVATSPGNDVLGTVIFTRAPLHFGHPHFG